MVMAAVCLICGCAPQRTARVDCEQVQVALSAYGWGEYVGDGAGVWVSAAQQEVRVVEGWRVVKAYRCSTARAGVGCVKDSGKTPDGWHRVGAKIGDGLPVGAVLKERHWTGEVWLPEHVTDDDLILSRILWLEGLEPGRNRGGDVDTWERYIYIHGTNRVEDLARPASGGCIRMHPADVIALYDAVDKGCLLLITEK